MDVSQLPKCRGSQEYVLVGSYLVPIVGLLRFLIQKNRHSMFWYLGPLVGVIAVYHMVMVLKKATIRLYAVISDCNVGPFVNCTHFGKSNLGQLPYGL